MAERYDAAIIGAGADGLAAAALLARARLKTIVLERETQAGGRLVTRQFHPGFRASPFADVVAPVPDDLFRALDLARHGALLAPGSEAIGLWPDRAVTAGAADLWAEAARRRANALAWARADAPHRAPWWKPFAPAPRDDGPAEDWLLRALADVVRDFPGADPALAAACALEGRGADPLGAGSALHLLTAAEAGLWRGALGGLGAAFASCAREAGAEIALGQEVSEIKSQDGRARALVLADGVEIAAPHIVSTLDAKRTFLSLFPWSALDKAVVKRLGELRMTGTSARLLVALSARPTSPQLDTLPRGAVHVAPDIAATIAAQAQARAGLLAERLPLTLRFANAVDPSLAPIGGATMTVTIGAVPFSPFDGQWTHEKRALLTSRVLAAIEAVFPGIGALVVASELVVPPDFEHALGVTGGDLWGGEIAPDQMFAFRPGLGAKPPHTPVKGLYLAGPSSPAAPFATGAAGALAAQAILRERRA